MMQVFRIAKVVLLFSDKGVRFRKAAGLSEELSNLEQSTFQGILDRSHCTHDLKNMINEDISVEDFKLLL